MTTRPASVFSCMWRPIWPVLAAPRPHDTYRWALRTLARYEYRYAKRRARLEARHSLPVSEPVYTKPGDER